MKEPKSIPSLLGCGTVLIKTSGNVFMHGARECLQSFSSVYITVKHTGYQRFDGLSLSESLFGIHLLAPDAQGKEHQSPNMHSSSKV